MTQRYNEFKAYSLGKWFDVDGAYSFQCFDLYAEYCKFLGVPYANCTVSGYAKDIWEQRHSNGTLNHFDEVEVLEPGDIVVFKEVTGWTPMSHIAVFDSDIDGVYGNFLGQNQGAPNGVTNVVRLPYSATYATSFRLKSSVKSPTEGSKSVVEYINRSYLNIGNLNGPKGVVIHNDAGSINATAKWYVDWLAGRDKTLGIAHYYIDRHTIARVVDTYKIAYHTGEPVGNGSMIGYEVCQSAGASDADFLANEDMTLRQVAEDMLFYNLPVNRDTVKLHREYVQTQCPHRSWALHGGSVNTVKDYFIQRIKHFQSLGKTVDEMLRNEKAPAVQKSAKPEAKLVVAHIDQKKLEYTVKVTDIKSPSGITKVLLPTWSDKNGQDDLKWYEVSGDYTLKVSSKAHNSDLGAFHTHAYIVTPDGVQHAVGGVKVVLDGKSPTGKLEVIKNEEQGTVTVKVTGVSNSNGIKEVQLPTWTEEGGQDDIQWYKAEKQADGSYVKTFSVKDHKGGTGKYNVHGYIKQDNGQSEGFGGVSFVFKENKPQEEQEVVIATVKGTKVKVVELSPDEFDKLKGGA